MTGVAPHFKTGHQSAVAPVHLQINFIKKYGFVAQSPTNINFNLTPTEEVLSQKPLGLLTFFGNFISIIKITLDYSAANKMLFYRLCNY